MSLKHLRILYIKILRLPAIVTGTRTVTHRCDSFFRFIPLFYFVTLELRMTREWSDDEECHHHGRMDANDMLSGMCKSKYFNIQISFNLFYDLIFSILKFSFNFRFRGKFDIFP